MRVSRYSKKRIRNIRVEEQAFPNVWENNYNDSSENVTDEQASLEEVDSDEQTSD